MRVYLVRANDDWRATYRDVIERCIDRRGAVEAERRVTRCQTYEHALALAARLNERDGGR